MHMNAVLNGPATKLIFRSIGVTRLHATARHPDRKSIVVMIAALRTFRGGSPSKLPSPNHQRVIQHATRLQVF